MTGGFAITVDAGDNVNNLLLIESSGGKGTINYTSATSNDTTKSGNFTIEGSNLGETKIEQVRWLTNVDGAMIAIVDLSGSVTVNGDDMGVSGDDDYDVHYVEGNLKQIRGISDGTTLNNHSSLLNEYMTDDDAAIHIGSGTFRWIN